MKYVLEKESQRSERHSNPNSQGQQIRPRKIGARVGEANTDSQLRSKEVEFDISQQQTKGSGNGDEQKGGCCCCSIL